MISLRTNHCLRILALAALSLALSAPALADTVIGAPGGASSWTVYAFSNAQAVADAFRALANFTASSTFQSIVGFIAVAGALAVGAASGFSPAVAKQFISYSVSVFLVCYVFFGVGNGGPMMVQVEVYDTVDGTWIAPVNVPAVVGIPASVISTAGQEITAQIEASFALPDALKMSKGAPFDMAAALIGDASRAKITDPHLAGSLAYYVQDCFVPAVARGEKSAATLITSTQFLEDIRWTNEAVMVNTMLAAPVGSATLVSCSQGWDLINTTINANGDAAAFLSNASAWAKTPALSVVNSSADMVAQWATNNGVTDGGAMVKQSAVLASFSGAFKQTAAATGNSDFLTGLSIAQAQTAQQTGWVMGAEVFNRSMGYIYAILQVFVYSVTPLVLAAALVPGLGMALIKNFGQILLWFAIWQPMLGIVNFIVLSMQQADLGGILAAGPGAYGFTLSNMGIVSEKTSTMRAAALFVGTMVPALSWALVKGSVDFSKVIGEAVGEKFAAGAANTMATGNYSLNQASMDSFTANKHSVGATFDAGQGFSMSPSGAINRKFDMGGDTNVAGSQSADVKAQDTLGTSASGQNVVGGAYQKGGSEADSNVHAKSYGKDGSLANGGSHMEDARRGHTIQGDVGDRWAAGGRKAGPTAPGVAAPGAPGVGALGVGSAADGAGVPADNGKPRGALNKTADGLAKLGSALLGTPSASVSAGVQAGNGVTDQKNKNASVGDKVGDTYTGSNTLGANEGGTAQNNASISTGYQGGQSVTVTGIASGHAQADALRAVVQPSSLIAGRYGAQGSLAQQQFFGGGSRISQATAAVSNVAGVEQAAAAEKGAVSAETDRLRRDAEQRHAAALAASTKTEDKSDAEMKRIQREKDNLAAGAKVGAIENMRTELNENVAAAMALVKDTDDDPARPHQANADPAVRASIERAGGTAAYFNGGRHPDASHGAPAQPPVVAGAAIPGTDPNVPMMPLPGGAPAAAATGTPTDTLSGSTGQSSLNGGADKDEFNDVQPATVASRSAEGPVMTNPPAVVASQPADTAAPTNPPAVVASQPADSAAPAIPADQPTRNPPAPGGQADTSRGAPAADQSNGNPTPKAEPAKPTNPYDQH